MATHSSILAWITLWTEEPAGYSPWGCKESDITERLTLSLFFQGSFAVLRFSGSMKRMSMEKELI